MQHLSELQHLVYIKFLLIWDHIEGSYKILGDEHIQDGIKKLQIANTFLGAKCLFVIYMGCPQSLCHYLEWGNFTVLLLSNALVIYLWKETQFSFEF